MPPPARPTVRSYLPAPQRREHLLDTAGRLVRQGGWSALSMQGLAAAAGVSRQLVYEHFATADELYLATLVKLFERAHAATEAIATSNASLADTVRAGFELFLDLPAEERHAIRTLAAALEPGRRGLARARTRLRNRIAGVWAPYVRRQTGVSEAEAVALSWMINTAAWGLSDSIADGTIDRRRAVDLFVRFAEGTLASFASNRRVRGSAPA